ncbi:MAG TPA: cyclic nucleotide-binding domain-containing protein [Beijerinckiaceae bacterium]
MLAIFAEACGWASVAASLYAFNSKTMIPLRVAIVVANVLALAWSGYNHNLPNLTLNAILLPLNILRLREMRRLVDDVKRASRAELDYDWLKPFMRPVELKAGETIFHRGDVADAAYVIGEGQVNLPELGVILGPGALMGEMGLFATGNRRMSAARAMSDVRLYRISYADFEQLYYQNPEFGLYIVRLMVRRMETNLSRLARPRPQEAAPGQPQPS